MEPVAAGPDGDCVAGGIDREARLLRCAAPEGEIDRRLPGAAGRHRRGLDHVLGAVVAAPEGDGVPGGVDAYVRFLGVVAPGGEIDRRLPGASRRPYGSLDDRVRPTEEGPDRDRVSGPVDGQLRRSRVTAGGREVGRGQPPRRGRRRRGGKSGERAEQRRQGARLAAEAQEAPFTLQVRVSLADSVRPSSKVIEVYANLKDACERPLGARHGADR
jgi:hypothetical protein